MFGLTVLAVGLAVVIGLAIKLLLGKFGTKTSWRDAHQITVREFIVVSLVLAAAVGPASSAIGTKLSVNEQLVYQQFVNGVETDTTEFVTDCRKGYASSSSGTTGLSNCSYSYISGYYNWEWVEMVTTCVSDGKGGQTCTTTPVVHVETAAIYTPYVTREHTYGIKSWMYDGKDGQMSFTFPDAYLDKSPVRYPASNRDIPGNLPKGPPADWLDAKTRLAAGDPRAVTKVASYKNYILASKDDVLKTYGPRIDDYKEAGLLPEHTANINTNPVSGPSDSQADKVSFVGVDMPDKDAWQKSVMRFNAALGTQLQGDLHVVLVNANTVPWSDAVPYTQSLKAYWQSDAFGRRAIAKNGIILVIGVDTSTNRVSWADASTGMPFGNETMIQFLRDQLPGTALEPAVLFGTPRTIVKDSKATMNPTVPQGVVEQIVFEKVPFKRFSMSCESENCIGYKDLASKIKPTTEAKVWVAVATVVISIGLWLMVGFTSFVDDFLGWIRNNVLPSRRSDRSADNINRRDLP